jgi:hypothetical protein
MAKRKTKEKFGKTTQSLFEELRSMKIEPHEILYLVKEMTKRSKVRIARNTPRTQKSGKSRVRTVR